MVTVNSSGRVLRLKQVQEKTWLGRPTIYDHLNPRSARFDNSFPRFCMKSLATQLLPPRA
ncbi:AlpA family phage regulatory protein [Pseudomonas sp. NPDC090592]|uniref:AlpA family phage regulatory protein n=1 Tax=Pseudomonas sp. NPDC090592 TaxID=3364480 RepID=UPI00383A95B5